MTIKPHAVDAQASTSTLTYDAPLPLTFKKVGGSNHNAHSTVLQGDDKVGEVWREMVHVTVSKLTAPRKTAKKWRWFSRVDSSSQTLGRGTRAALIFGAGFSSRAEALNALMSARAEHAAAVDTMVAHIHDILPKADPEGSDRL